MRILFLSCLVAASLAGLSFCKYQSGNETKQPATSVEKMASPSLSIVRKWDMPAALKEISGIQYLGGNRFACIQDEQGIIYIYNTATEKVEKEIPFAGAGDYEGITVVGTDAYILRSDGFITEVLNFESRPAVREFKTSLTAKENTEGICYDKKNNRLLVTVKGADASSEDYKGIYAFDLKQKKSEAKPVYTINLTDKVFESPKAKKTGKSIQPSDLAINPRTGDMLILDGPHARLLITDAAGSIKSLVALGKERFPQAEGITFGANNEIYISNEGPGKRTGTILQVEL